MYWQAIDEFAKLYFDVLLYSFTREYLWQEEYISSRASNLKINSEISKDLKTFKNLDAFAKYQCFLNIVIYILRVLVIDTDKLEFFQEIVQHILNWKMFLLHVYVINNHLKYKIHWYWKSDIMRAAFKKTTRRSKWPQQTGVETEESRLLMGRDSFETTYCRNNSDQLSYS